MITRSNGATGGVSQLVRLAMVLAVASVAVGASTAWAEEKLPKAETLIEKYIKATGGRAAYEKRHNSEADLTLEVPMANLKMKMKLYEAAPNKQYVLMEGPMGKSEQGTDGKVAWSCTDMQGPMILEGDARDEAIRDATFNQELHWHKMHKKIECVGTATVGDKACYKLVMTPPTGNPGTYFFDKESGLLLQVDLTRGTPMGDVQVSSFYEDYKEVDGVLQPHKITQKMPMGEQVITINHIKYNVEMPKDRFDPPAAVRKKLEQQKEGKDEREHGKGDDHERGT